MTTTENRDIVYRCCVCGRSMHEDGRWLSDTPVHPLAWTNIALVFMVSDGQCNKCESAERAQFDADAAAFRASQMTPAAVGV